MISYFPQIYPDELLYSQLARYYYKSGYMAYIFAAEDLFTSRWVRPDIEFLNSYTQDAYGVITKKLPLYEVIMKYTMFPYYGRFLDKERRNKAFSAIVNMQGGYRNLLAIPKTNKARYLRYCPLCVNGDRQKYGEAYWHRIHQMMGVDDCPMHFCSLINSDVLISSKAPPRLVTAEEVASENCGYTVNYNDTEKRLYKYIFAVFNSDIDLENDVQIGDYLSYRLQNTKYMTGKMRNMKALTYDYNEFYGTETELWRIEKVLTNDDFKLKNICMLAMFLNITPEELCNPSLPESVWKRIRKVEYVHDKPGVKTKNWAEIDDKILPDVRKAIKELLNNDPPKRVTVYAVEQMLKLPSKQIEHLQKCKNKILKYYESQEEFWARKVSWAISKIQEGINRLADCGLITVLNESDNGMKIDVSNLIFQTSKGGFVIIDKAIFSKIKKIETLNYSKAIVYFCILKSTVNSKSKLGKTGIRKLSKYTGCSYSTLIKMNEAFEANGIMCIEKGNQYCANKYSVCEFQPETRKNNKDIEDINADIKDQETVIDTTSEKETDYYSRNPYLD